MSMLRILGDTLDSVALHLDWAWKEDSKSVINPYNYNNEIDQLINEEIKKELTTKTFKVDRKKCISASYTCYNIPLDITSIDKSTINRKLDKYGFSPDIFITPHIINNNLPVIIEIKKLFSSDFCDFLCLDSLQPTCATIHGKATCWQINSGSPILTDQHGGKIALDIVRLLHFYKTIYEANQSKPKLFFAAFVLSGTSQTVLSERLNSIIKTLEVYPCVYSKGESLKYTSNVINLGDPILNAWARPYRVKTILANTNGFQGGVKGYNRKKGRNKLFSILFEIIPVEENEYKTGTIQEVAKKFTFKANGANYPNNSLFIQPGPTQSNNDCCMIDPWNVKKDDYVHYFDEGNADIDGKTKRFTRRILF